MTRVLLLEDLPGFDALFGKVFGVDNVDAYRNFEDLRDGLAQPRGWEYAFLDFSLGEDSAFTGLSAFNAVRNASPRTRTIGFSSLKESSRPLFAAAAHHWFGMWALMDKSDASPATLEQIGRGENPTRRGWAEKLRNHAYLVDGLFNHPRSGEMWRATSRAGGTATGYKAHLPSMTAKVARTIIDATVEEAINFSAAFLGADGLGTTKPQPVMLEFHRANQTFFLAPDLLDVLDQIKPWARHRGAGMTRPQDVAPRTR
jgi:hypothetical protein